MNLLVSFGVRLLESMFVIGMVGSALVIAPSAVESTRDGNPISPIDSVTSGIRGLMRLAARMRPVSVGLREVPTSL